MKRVLVVLVGIVVVAGGAWWAWLETTDIDDPVDVTAPPIDESVDSTAPADTSGTTGVGDQAAGTTAEEEGSSGTVFQLGDGSSVTFQLDEELNGSPKTVLATNSEVAAQIALDPADLANTRIGTVVVGAQTFETDSSNRNRAIRGPILDSNEFPTIEFVPTSIEGLSGSATTGQMFDFTVTGDLTIRGITQSVTFDVSASMPDQSTIEGSAEATVNRTDFDLQIPSVPSVANVSEEVLIRIDFVATPT